MKHSSLFLIYYMKNSTYLPVYNARPCISAHYTRVNTVVLNALHERHFVTVIDLFCSHVDDVSAQRKLSFCLLISKPLIPD